MAAFLPNEVVPGVVVHVESDQLRGQRAESNADPQRIVIGPHYFLVLSVNGNTVTCVPLYSDRARRANFDRGPDKVLLPEGGKSGHADDWLGEDTFYSKWQFWRVHVNDLCAASGSDRSPQQDRRKYAANAPAALRQIAEWITRNRNGFQPVA
jgi:hypothetical protein